MKIESEKALVNAAIGDVYEFLKNTANIEKLLPKNEVKEFKSDADSCSFKVQGGITIALIQDELNPNESIKMKSGEKAPFPFELIIYLNDKNNTETEGYIIFEGKVNPFLQAMVKKPLSNLFNHMTKSLQAVFQ